MPTIQQDKQLITRLLKLEQLIGNTPLHEFSSLLDNPKVKLYAKLEWLQLGGSVKARPAFNIIRNALVHGQLTPDKTLLDASSGNTAIAYASIAASLGIKVQLFVPENASDERKRMLTSLGAELVLTSSLGSTDEAQLEALQTYENNPDSYFYANQYGNDYNWMAHYHDTAPEIVLQTQGAITHFVTGLGTTGTFTGTARGLKSYNRKIEAIALHPATAMHGLEGWKHLETARVPGIYDASLADAHQTVDTNTAYELMKTVAQQEGLLISPSAAANLAGALEVANSLEEGTVVTILPDNAEKYGDVFDLLYQN